MPKKPVEYVDSPVKRAKALAKAGKKQAAKSVLRAARNKAVEETTSTNRMDPLFTAKKPALAKPNRYKGK